MKAAATAAEALWRRVPLLLLVRWQWSSACVFLAFMLAATRRPLRAADRRLVPGLPVRAAPWPRAIRSSTSPESRRRRAPPASCTRPCSRSRTPWGSAARAWPRSRSSTGAALMCVSVVLAFAPGVAPRRPARGSAGRPRSSPWAARSAGRYLYGADIALFMVLGAVAAPCDRRRVDHGPRGWARGMRRAALPEPGRRDSRSRCVVARVLDARTGSRPDDEGRARGVGARRRRARRARAVPRGDRRLDRHVGRRQVAVRDLRLRGRARRSPPSTASTWCAACCSASIPRRRRSDSAAAGRRSRFRRWACCSCW